MLVPKLRFKEFADEWKTEKVGDSCNVLMCKRIFADQTSIDEEIPFYKIGTIGTKADTFISRMLFEEYRNKYNYPRKNELLITCSGTVGKCTIFDGKDSYYQDSNIVWIDNPTMKINNKFLYYLISKVDWSKLNSTTITRIYNDNLRKLKLNYPINNVEQEKIANFLSLLDKKIELQTRKIEVLKLYKKGNIINYFKNLTINKKELITFGNFYSGNAIGKDAEINKGVPLVLYGDLYTTFDEVILEVNKYCVDKKSYFRSVKNDLIFPTSTTVDAISLISPSSIKLDGIIYGGDLLIFRPNNNNDINSDYLSFQINNYLKKDFSKMCQGSTIIHIHKKELEHANIYVEEITKQLEFSNCFNNFNKKILNETSKLELLNQLKKGLMQNMFV